MTGFEVPIGLGFSLAIALILFAIFIVTRKWQVLPSLLSLATLNVYLTSINPEPTQSPHYLLFASLVLAVIAIACFWGEMF